MTVRTGPKLRAASRRCPADCKAEDWFPNRLWMYRWTSALNAELNDGSGEIDILRLNFT